jgi:hypothetical protein
MKLSRNNYKMNLLFNKICKHTVLIVDELSVRLSSADMISVLSRSVIIIYIILSKIQIEWLFNKGTKTKSINRK